MTKVILGNLCDAISYAVDKEDDPKLEERYIQVQNKKRNYYRFGMQYFTGIADSDNVGGNVFGDYKRSIHFICKICETCPILAYGRPRYESRS